MELADIFRAELPRYGRTHRLSLSQSRAVRDIVRCRTAAAGGRAQRCDTCGATRIVYNSCRNRHCPKCQSLQRERWLARRCAEVLDVEYFHVVFTLPHQLNSLAQGNPRVLYGLVFEAAAGALKTLGEDPRRLGGLVGVTAVLHTWGRNLSQHIHLHCLVPGGALAANGSAWIPARTGFLFPVRALSKLFRGKYLAALQHAFDEDNLRFAATTRQLAHRAAFAAWLRRLRRINWVVYCKPPMAGPQQVLSYLGRYTHRIAISNDRLISFRDGTVRFRWKDHADNGRVKLLALPTTEFIRRFLLHVLPRRFTRIRHYGLLANRSRHRKLAACRRLLGQAPPPDKPSDESAHDFMLRLTGTDIDLCPFCKKGRLHLVQTLPALRHPGPQPAAFDSS